MAASSNPVSSLFADRRVNTKILVLLAITSLVSAVVGVLAITRISLVNTQAQTLYTGNVKSLDNLGQTRIDAVQTQLELTNHSLATTPAGRATYLANIQAGDKAVAADLAAYTADPMKSARWQKDIATFKDSWAAWQKVRDTVLLPASDTGDVKTFTRMRDKQAQPVAATALAALADLAAFERTDAKSVSQTATSNYHSARTSVIVVLAIGLVAALALGLFIGRLITTPLKKVSAVLKGMAAGDLTLRADVSSKDELGMMATDLN
ncbi:MAG: methyl-accepting chemotaxis protein, partial [Frankiales bacterium]|nr:methyl-accepting chemotaxis protein [Frankiales bacterium]